VIFILAYRISIYSIKHLVEIKIIFSSNLTRIKPPLFNWASHNYLGNNIIPIFLKTWFSSINYKKYKKRIIIKVLLFGKIENYCDEGTQNRAFFY